VENQHTINALTRKRAEIAGQIEHCQQRMRGLVIDLDHVDAALRMFAPDIDLQAIPNRPLPPIHLAFKGEVTRIAMAMFKTAGSPITTVQIAERLMVERGLDPLDLKLRSVMIKRAGGLITSWRNQKIIRESGERTAKSGEGAFKAWVLVTRESAEELTQ
jgi:hypothetical protein